MLTQEIKYDSTQKMLTEYKTGYTKYTERIHYYHNAMYSWNNKDETDNMLCLYI